MLNPLAAGRHECRTWELPKNATARARSQKGLEGNLPPYQSCSPCPHVHSSNKRRFPAIKNYHARVHGFARKTPKPRLDLNKHSPQSSCQVLLTSDESQSKPGIKMVYAEPCKELPSRSSAAVSGWDCPITNPSSIPGFFEHAAQIDLTKRSLKS